MKLNKQKLKQKKCYKKQNLLGKQIHRHIHYTHPIMYKLKKRKLTKKKNFMRNKNLNNLLLT